MKHTLTRNDKIDNAIKRVCNDWSKKKNCKMQTFHKGDKLFHLLINHFILILCMSDKLFYLLINYFILVLCIRVINYFIY